MSDRPLSERKLSDELRCITGYDTDKLFWLVQKCVALEAERDELEAYLMDTLNQLDDCKLGYIDCLKSRSFELRRLEAERDRLREGLQRVECACLAFPTWGDIATCPRCATLEEGGE